MSNYLTIFPRYQMTRWLFRCLMISKFVSFHQPGMVFEVTLVVVGLTTFDFFLFGYTS